MDCKTTAKAAKAPPQVARSAQKRKREDPDVIFVGERKRSRPSDEEEVLFVKQSVGQPVITENAKGQLVVVSFWFS